MYAVLKERLSLRYADIGRLTVIDMKGLRVNTPAMSRRALWGFAVLIASLSVTAEQSSMQLWTQPQGRSSDALVSDQQWALHWKNCADTLDEAITEYTILLNNVTRSSEAEIVPWNYRGVAIFSMLAVVAVLAFMVWQGILLNASEADKERLKVMIRLRTDMWRAACAETAYFAQRLLKHYTQESQVRGQ